MEINVVTLRKLIKMPCAGIKDTSNSKTVLMFWHGVVGTLDLNTTLDKTIIRTH